MTGFGSRLAVLAAAALAATAALLGCRREAGEAENGSGEHEKPPFHVEHTARGETIVVLEPEAIEAAGIETTSPVAVTIEDEVTTFGVLVADPSRSAVLRAPLAGTLRADASDGAAKASWPTMGAHVDAGTLLGEFVPRVAPLTPAEKADVQSKLVTARAEKTSIEAELAASHAAYERVRKLNAADKGASDQVVEAAAATVAGGEARLAAAKANVDLFEQLAASGGVAALDPVPLLAPRSGEVVAVAASPGESVEAGAELLRIADFSELFADVRVPFDAPAPEGKAFVSIPVTAEQRVLEADVVGPAPDADRAVRLVRLRVRDPENRLRPGLAIEARIAGNAPARPGFRVPSAALLRYASRTWVFVESESGHYVRRAVAFARSRGGEAFVTEGVRAEEKVVSVGAMTLLSQEQLSAGGGEGE